MIRQENARLACSGVSVYFGGLAAVQDVDLSVPAGAIVGLVGPNGAGKSTLFGVLSGLLRPTRGKVVLDGVDVTQARPQVRSAMGLSRTFQHPELFVGLTVRDHLVLAHRVKHQRQRIWSDLLTMGSLRRADPAEDRSVDELVQMLGLNPVADRPAIGLPLGLARLLELGRALAASPTVLLLDEPSSGLDSSESLEFERTLTKVSNERGISVLLVEHDVDMVMRLCSSVYVLDFGLLVASGAPEEVRANPAVRAAYLGEKVPTAEGGSPDGAVIEDTVTDGFTHPSGLRIEAVEAPAHQPDHDPGSGYRRGVSEHPALAVEDLTVRYGEATALFGASFELQAGNALAVLGANGAGKSSLARAVSGLVTPSGGRILLGGEEITHWPAHRVRRAGVVFLPESRGVFRSMTVMDNLRVAVGGLETRRTRREGVERALEIFPALAARRRQQACLLSGGEQQMLSLARAIATFPQILIADEMSLGLAPKMVDVVFEGLARARREGVTLIMVEQYVHRALEFADQCIVLQRGELVWSGPASSAHGEVLRHYIGDAMVAAG